MRKKNNFYYYVDVARAKHASKKFGDEKMPMAKHHLVCVVFLDLDG